MFEDWDILWERDVFIEGDCVADMEGPKKERKGYISCTLSSPLGLGDEGSGSIDSLFFFLPVC